MKLHLDRAHGEFRITGYSGQAITVNQVPHAGAIIVRVDTDPEAWEVADPSDLDAATLTALAELTPEVLLIGTGGRQRFPEPAALAALYRSNVGFEIMDTAAACRTFNILAAEGRRVVAALLPRELEC